MIKSRNKTEKLLVWAIGIITIIVTPFYSYDPINLPRFIMLIVFGLIILFTILIPSIKLILSQYSLFLILILGFIAWSLLSLVLSGVKISEGFFGVPGRFNGVLTYMALIVFMATTLLLSTYEFNLLLVKVLAISGVISAIYGLIQYKEMDPFGWINEYSPVFGFFGNPNFQASFLGISACAALALFLNTKAGPLFRFSLASYILFAMFIISKSKSQQGFLVFAAGASVIIFLWIRGNSRLSKLKILYFLTWSVGGIAVLLDILQKSPWRSVVYKESVSYRGDFWRAGWNMTVENPIFGVGFSGYGDNFRQYRDFVSANRVEISSNVDSAHNIFLDISSSGGFPLLAIYFSLILLTLVSAIRILRRSVSFDFVFAAIFGSWVAYTAQSIISVNQIGIAIWGWVLSGAIIGYENHGRSRMEIIPVKNEGTKVLAISGGLILGLLLTMPFFIADAQFRSTVRAGDVNKIMTAVQKWPKSVENMNFVTVLFTQGGFPDQSLIIARKAVEFNPKSFESWQLLYKLPNVTEAERLNAFTKMKQLDPLNPIFR